MIEKFPITINTHSGCRAIVTNPEKGHYHFDVKSPANFESFDWFDLSYEGKEKLQGVAGEIKIIEDELLHTFWQLQT